MDRSEVYKLIDAERTYQDEVVWPENTLTTPHSLRIGEDLLLIERYLRTAIDTWTQEKRPEMNTMSIIRKIAGICVRSMEINGAPSR